MVFKKLFSSEKIFLPLIINLFLFGGIFAFGLLGLTTNLILLILAAAIFLEVIYITTLIQISVNKNVKGLNEVKKQINKLQKDEEKTYNGLIYTGHQMKTMQRELSALKKGSIFKPNDNGHLPRLRA
ncbi:hypothetical protein KKE78_05575 [Patescibacteria group bacterium]|nr:hypothetical protein [Patescibacteria group bacterium]